MTGAVSAENVICPVSRRSGAPENTNRGQSSVPQQSGMPCCEGGSRRPARLRSVPQASPNVRETLSGAGVDLTLAQSFGANGSREFRQLCARNDGEGLQPSARQRFARVPGDESPFRPASPSQAKDDNASFDNSGGSWRSIVATTTRSLRRRDPKTLGESSRLAVPRMETAKESGVP